MPSSDQSPFDDISGSYQTSSDDSEFFVTMDVSGDGLVDLVRYGNSGDSSIGSEHWLVHIVIE